MKTILIRLLAAASLLGAGASAQTINWGSEVFSDLRDSNGLTLDDLFVFEIGAFDPGFSPLETNTTEWLDNWNVFDRAAYNGPLGYFTGTTEMTDAGLSISPALAADIPSFEGMSAYLWIRKGDLPVPGSEWLVVRATDWTFPTAVPGCCDNGLPVEWSVSELTTGDTPKWGRQGDQPGPGIYTVTDTHTLQTYTFVPEPSATLTGLLSLPPLLRRRRKFGKSRPEPFLPPF
jgi:hypothetical protein